MKADRPVEPSGQAVTMNHLLDESDCSDCGELMQENCQLKKEVRSLKRELLNAKVVFLTFYIKYSPRCIWSQSS